MTRPDDASGYDAIVVGASIAGCTTAIMFGRAGLRVALVERSRRFDAYKALCGHWILGGAKPTLVRLGLWQEMLAQGAEAALPDIWTAGAWLTLPRDAGIPEAISLRRSTLDPMLRRIAAATPGVDLLMGHPAVELVEDGARIVGVRVAAPSGGERELRGRLVVGADGHRSKVAALAGVVADVAPNERFFVWVYYRGVRFRRAGRAFVWRLDPDVAVAVPAGEGLTLLGAFPAKSRLAEFAGDRVVALERFLADLPDAPDLSAAERVSAAVGTSDYPIVRRHPAPRPGLALVGDAAMASDPTPAVGCGWAIRSAEWLADAVVPVLAGGASDADLAAALARYCDAHRFAEEHDDVGRIEALAQPSAPGQQAMTAAAFHDPDIARRLGLFAMRAVPPSVLRDPEVLARAAQFVANGV